MSRRSSSRRHDGLWSAGVLTAVAIIVPFSGARADQRATLTPGLYQAGPNGCAHPSGAGAMTFDGANFSGNHQFCKTTPAEGQDQYRLECMDLMGGQKTAADFDRDPNKEVFTLAIKVVNKHEFSVNGQSYDYCGGLK
jgi:hypothetical protein